MSRLFLTILFVSLVSMSFGQGKVFTDSSGKKWQIYNRDTIAYAPTAAEIDTSNKMTTTAVKEIVEKKPVMAAKDTPAPALPAKPIMATASPAIRKAADKKKKEGLQPVLLGSGDPVSNKEMQGKWQMESTEMADGYYYTYTFLRGNEFIFGNDENEGLNRIIKLEGTYYLKKDTLVIYVKQELDLVGGSPELSEITGGSGWVVKGGKLVKKDLPKVQQYNLPIRPCEEKDGKSCIEINSMSYYKLE